MVAVITRHVAVRSRKFWSLTRPVREQRWRRNAQDHDRYAGSRLAGLSLRNIGLELEAVSADF